MFGVNFISGYNSLIVLGAEFVVRSNVDTRYKWDSGPGGERLQKQNWGNDEWETIQQPLDEILPSHCGFDWKTSDFILALSFWCEGRNAGKAQAR